MLEFSKIKKNIAIILVVLSIFIFGIYIGIHGGPKIERWFGFPSSSFDDKPNLDSFWKTWNAIDKKYPGAQKVSEQDRIYGAIGGLVSSLNDPYSTFFTPEETKLFEEDIAGNFSGVGMEVGIKDKVLTVIAPLKNTPAYKAGIKSGDRILKIDETITADLNIEKAIKLIRGVKGTTVTLTVLPKDSQEPKEIKIIRDIIDIPTLDTELKPNGVFVIRLYSFSAKSSNLFREAMKEFVKSKSDKLLLDLRGNPGGYLESAVDIASWFLENGKTVVIEDYGNDKKTKTYRSDGYNIFNDNLKFVILINGGSASASEILAGAMQDYGKAKLVGEQSYGKGSVQEVVKITPDTIFKVTVAKWLTPNGMSISEKGLTPDFVVEFTTKEYLEKKDPQMEKAIELLLAN